jgi:hypothetical protein
MLKELILGKLGSGNHHADDRRLPAEAGLFDQTLSALKVQYRQECAEI